MSNSNNISATVSTANLQNIKTSLTKVVTILDFLINLTPKQRKALFKMGKKSVSYVQLALSIAKNHPQILTKDFDVAEFEKDVNLSAALVDIETVLGPLAEGVADTLMAVGAEAMKQANNVNDLVKLAAKKDANMKVLAGQLAERYKGQGKKAAKSSTPPPTKTN